MEQARIERARAAADGAGASTPGQRGILPE